MDISDILTSVAVANPRPHTSSTSAGRPPTTAALHPRFLDQQALTRAWINERVAPELLPYPSELIQRCSTAVEGQIEVLEGMAGSGYGGDEGEGGGGGGYGGGGKGGVFEMVVLQTELERFRFLMRGFLRARIAKIDRHPQHYLALHQSPSSTDSPSQILSPLESQYAQTHTALLSTHYTSSFLSSFPQQLQRLDDATGSGSSGGMVDRPEVDGAVFCRGLRDCVVRSTPGGDEDDEGEGDRSEEGSVEVRRGDVWVLRWRAVRGAVGRGDLELI